MSSVPPLQACLGSREVSESPGNVSNEVYPDRMRIGPSTQVMRVGAHLGDHRRSERSKKRGIRQNGMPPNENVSRQVSAGIAVYAECVICGEMQVPSGRPSPCASPPPPIDQVTPAVHEYPWGTAGETSQAIVPGEAEWQEATWGLPGNATASEAEQHYSPVKSVGEISVTRATPVAARRAQSSMKSSVGICYVSMPQAHGWNAP